MSITNPQDERAANMTFASVYPHYVNKVEKEGRTKAELHEIIKWLTGYDEKKLQQHIQDEATFETFFKEAKMNSNAHLITGVICGHSIEDIENTTTKQVRYLDKLVDELARGRKMDNNLRSS